MGKKKILLVDDHQDFRELLTTQLKFFGWEVISACSGRKALEKLKVVRPNLILLDMWMPEMDGFELAQLLKKDPEYRDIPILGITAMEVPEAEGPPLKAGCDDCISKPFRFGELRERVTDLMCKSARPAAK